MPSPSLPIGVFDSGVGGLTVLSALQKQLPNESFLYLGDTARIPYGTKSESTVSQYALSACQFLMNEGIKLLVIACNTATALALPALEKTITELPIVGVIEPGAEAAIQKTKSGTIAVLGTEATIEARSYQHAIHRLRPDFTVIGQSCTMFVALAEEGWSSGPVARAVAHEYLVPLFTAYPAIDTLLLGCTHFPVLQETVQDVIGPDVLIVDSAHATAQRVDEVLQSSGLKLPNSHQKGRSQFFVTDAPARFTRVACRFINHEITPEAVNWVDLLQFQSRTEQAVA